MSNPVDVMSRAIGLTDGSWSEPCPERNYYANKESILTAQEDMANEKAADAGERSAAYSEEGL